MVENTSLVVQGNNQSEGEDEVDEGENLLANSGELGREAIMGLLQVNSDSMTLICRN